MDSIIKLRTEQDPARAPRVWPGFQPLNTPISPIFRPSSFIYLEWWEADSIADQKGEAFLEHEANRMYYGVYQRMQPGLRLASLFLESARPVLMRVVCAPILEFRNAPNTYSSWLQDEWIPSSTDHRLYDYTMQQMQHEFRVFYSKPTHVKNTGPNYIGITGTAARLVNGNIRIRSALSLELLNQFYADDWDARPQLHQFSTLILMAVTLIHEFVHVLWKHRIRFNYLRVVLLGEKQPLEEVLYFSTDLERELGQAFEVYFFGVVVGPPSNSDNFPYIPPDFERLKFDGVWGLRGYTYDRLNQQTTWEIAPETIRSLFDARTWRRVGHTVWAEIDFCLIAQPKFEKGYVNPRSLVRSKVSPPDYDYDIPGGEFPPATPTEMLHMVRPPVIPTVDTPFLPGRRMAPNRFLATPMILQPPPPGFGDLISSLTLNPNPADASESAPSSSGRRGAISNPGEEFIQWPSP